MKRLDPLGIWEVFVPGVQEGCLYKYHILTEKDQELYKADPFASASELRPGNASKVADISKFRWTDTTWMNKRVEKNPDEEPMSIYEYIRVPGKNIRMIRRQKTVFTAIRNLLMLW